MCPPMNLADSATPALAAIFSSLAWSTGPARPTYSGRVTPRARTRADPVPQRGRVEAEVADQVGGVCRLSHMAWMVMSSPIFGWLCG